MAAGTLSDISVVWQPQPGPQTALVTCPVFEVLFGGSRGGGKTDAMVGDWLSHSDQHGEHAIGLMVRRKRTELVETIERFAQVCRPLGGRIVDNVLRMPNGARLRFAYLERDGDADNYQGHSYTRVYVEEMGNFPRWRPIAKLIATLRSGAGVPCCFRATANPGGPGHNWVRARYIDPAPLGWKIITDATTGLERIYIPSRLQDNKYLGQQYINQLKDVGSPALVRAWLEGDWSAIDGAYFPEWSTAKHVLTPFVVPPDWRRFRSLDWGSAKPFSAGWWAIVPQDTPLSALAGGGRYYTASGLYGTGGGLLLPGGGALNDREQARGRVVGVDEEQRTTTLPRGSLVRYREWYGSDGQPNVGLKLTAEQVARKIIEKSEGEQFAYTVVDPSMFATDGGPSLAENMIKAKLTGLRPADNKRTSTMGHMGGWDQLRGRLRGPMNDNGDPCGSPLIYCFSTCTDSIRTIPVLQHDKDHPEDLDSEAEDHAADEWRYAAMSRPVIPKKPEHEGDELAKALQQRDEVVYQALPGGRVVANMSVMEAVQARLRRKKAA